jgi:hypothetical protein
LSAEDLRITVSDSNLSEKIIVKIKDMTYLSMSSTLKRVQITCEKKESSQNGALIVMVNNKAADANIPCNSYSGFTQDDYFCILKTFAYDLTNENTDKSFYEISCSIDETNITQISKLYKLCEY